jgi:hypothetical protein
VLVALEAGHTFELAHDLGRCQRTVHRLLGLLAQVLRQPRIAHQELGIADRQRQLVGDTVLHGIGRRACALEAGKLGLSSAAGFLTAHVPGDLSHDGPAGDNDDPERQLDTDLARQIVHDLRSADDGESPQQGKPGEPLDTA